MNATTDAALSAGYLAIEGIDGAGSTTQRDLVLAKLRRLGISSQAAIQPSGGPIGSLLREVLRPSITAGQFVVSDRCEMTTAVYLAARHALISGRFDPQAFADVETAFSWNASTLHPGLVILVDVPVEIAAQRRAARGGPLETLDAEAFQARARKLYLHATDVMMVDSASKVRVVDGSGTPVQVHVEVWKHVALFVEAWLEARGLEAVR